jgi:hypothetical protein
MLAVGLPMMSLRGDRPCIHSPSMPSADSYSADAAGVADHLSVMHPPLASHSLR